MSNKYKNVELVKPSGLELKDRLVSVNRVTSQKVVEPGLPVVGDENGVVGHGLGKSKDVSEATRRRWKMLRKFSKNSFEWPSVPHEQKGKFGGACI
jgi:small subunit ribosomal protein S5